MAAFNLGPEMALQTIQPARGKNHLPAWKFLPLLKSSLGWGLVPTDFACFLEPLKWWWWWWWWRPRSVSALCRHCGKAVHTRATKHLDSGSPLLRLRSQVSTQALSGLSGYLTHLCNGRRWQDRCSCFGHREGTAGSDRHKALLSPCSIWWRPVFPLHVDTSAEGPVHTFV